MIKGDWNIWCTRWGWANLFGLIKSKRTPYCCLQLPNRRVWRKWSQTLFGGPRYERRQWAQAAMGEEISSVIHFYLHGKMWVHTKVNAPKNSETSLKINVDNYGSSLRPSTSRYLIFTIVTSTCCQCSVCQEQNKKWIYI